MIDVFLARAYLFDDGNLKVILNFTNDKREFTKKLEDFEIKGSVGGTATIRLGSASVHQRSWKPK